MGDLGADRSHQQALESAGPAGTDDEQVGVGGRLEERLGGQAGDGPDGDRRGPGFGADLLECAGRLFLGRLAAVLGQVLVARVEDGAAPVSDDGLLDGGPLARHQAATSEEPLIRPEPQGGSLLLHHAESRFPVGIEPIRPA